MYCLVLLFVFSLVFAVSTAQAEVCGTSTPSLKGKFSTFSIGNNTLGLLKGKCTSGKERHEGAISGEILEQPNPSTVISKHVLAIPGYGLLFTGPDILTVIGPDSMDPCILHGEEEINIVGGTQDFANCVGSGFAEGTINICTGENNFSYEAELICE